MCSSRRSDPAPSPIWAKPERSSAGHFRRASSSQRRMRTGMPLTRSFNASSAEAQDLYVPVFQNTPEIAPAMNDSHDPDRIPIGLVDDEPGVKRKEQYRSAGQLLSSMSLT